MTRPIISFATFAVTMVLCTASPVFAQNVSSSADSSMVFIPQAKPRATIPKTNRHRVQHKRTGTSAPAVDAKSGTLVSETHGDWTVNCAATKEKKSCTISQAQINKSTGQRVFAIELRASKDAPSAGTILMPFGLNLGAGVVVKVDGEEQKLPFSTCLAQGCIVTVALPTTAINAIRNAKMFSVRATSINDGQVISFNISLNGFGAALARASHFAD